jgi:hypothetical protein
LPNLLNINLHFRRILLYYDVALRNATMAIGRSRRPRGPTYARGANRSQFEDPELAVNARHLATRRAHPAFKFFTSLIPEAESFNLESAESFVHELSTEKKAVLLPLWGARRHLGDLQKV